MLCVSHAFRNCLNHDIINNNISLFYVKANFEHRVTFFIFFPVSSMQIIIMFVTFVNGFVTEPLGRKKSFILGQIFMLVGWIIIYFSPNFATLIGGRSVMGLGVGITYPISNIYLAEISLVSGFSPRDCHEKNGLSLKIY